MRSYIFANSIKTTTHEKHHREIICFHAQEEEVGAAQPQTRLGLIACGRPRCREETRALPVVKDFYWTTLSNFVGHQEQTGLIQRLSMALSHVHATSTRWTAQLSK